MINPLTHVDIKYSFKHATIVNDIAGYYTSVTLPMRVIKSTFVSFVVIYKTYKLLYNITNSHRRY